MANGFSVGKLVLFTSSTAIGGLAQVWFLYVALRALDKEHSLAALLGDGGLFFFTTSLTATSALLLFEQLPGKPSSWDLALTLLAVAISGGAVVYYIAVLTNHLGAAAPFHDHAWPQIASAIVAFVYAVFTAAETGYFNR